MTDGAVPGFESFLKTSALFLVGLVAVLFICERSISAHLRRQALRPKASEVLRAQVTARSRSDTVRSIYLGDSVARQLFLPGTEPAKDVRFLTTNQAVSLAGQCYLLETSLAVNPHLADVYLFYIPGCFGNNLPLDLSRDYLCAYFNRPAQVAEVFRVKHDAQLTAVHIGRMLLPNLMIENSAWDPIATSLPAQAPAPHATAAFLAQPMPDHEPLLSLLDRLWNRPPDPPPTPAGNYGQVLPPVSSYFLEKMRTLCRARGVKLHVLPCPLSTAETFSDPQHIYDAPPIRVDPEVLMDPVHFRSQYVAEYRRRVIAAYHLPLNDPTAHPHF